MSVVTRLSNLGKDWNGEPIRDFAAYVAVTTFTIATPPCVGSIRNAPVSRTGCVTCCLTIPASRRGRVPRVGACARCLPGPDRQNCRPRRPDCARSDDSAATLVAAAGGANSSGPREVWLVLALLNRAGGPVELDELTTVVGQLLELTESSTAAPSGDSKIEELANPRASIAAELAEWRSISNGSGKRWKGCRCDNGSLSCSTLRDAQGRSVLGFLRRQARPAFEPSPMRSRCPQGN